MMNKKELRTYISAQKKNISPEARFELSAPILRRLAAHPRFAVASTVLLYHSLPDEVDTHNFIRYWGTKKNILLPVVKGTEIELRRYNAEEDLNEGAYGILEPQGMPFEDYASIDLAVVPGVAFDGQGNRMGRGKGYYDRLLARLKEHPIYIIGIGFPFQMVESVPAEAHDIPMDEVL